MALSADSPERGSMILFLFIAIALFGALSYAFTHGSRNSVSMLQGVQSDAAGTATQDCTNTVNLAVKRLELRGCGSKISYLADGSNSNADAPTDGSCSVFHPNGGGAKACNASAIAPVVPFDITTLLPGQTGGGVVYVGNAMGKRIYTTPQDQTSTSWNKGTSAPIITMANNPSGIINTNNLVSRVDIGSPYRASIDCRAIGAKWYLPSLPEATLLRSSINLGDLSGTFTANGDYWTSYEASSGKAYTYKAGTAIQTMTDKHTLARIRCVRSD